MRGPPEGDPCSPAVLDNSALVLLPVFLIIALNFLLTLLVLALALLSLLAAVTLTVLTILGHAAHLPSARLVR